MFRFLRKNTEKISAIDLNNPDAVGSVTNIRRSHNPFGKNYWGCCKIKDDYYTSVCFQTIDGNNMLYHQPHRCYANFLTPTVFPHVLWVGRVLELYEGSRLVGTMVIEEIKNKDLECKNDLNMLSTVQTEFFEAIKDIQERAIVIALNENKDQLSEDSLYSVTYDTICGIMELFDGYYSPEHKYDLRNLISDESVNKNIELHDAVVDYIKFQRYTKIKVVKAFIMDGIHHFVPQEGSFDMIYRAAKGVYWCEKYSSLYYKDAVSYETAFYWINEALKNEYSTMLYL